MEASRPAQYGEVHGYMGRRQSRTEMGPLGVGPHWKIRPDLDSQRYRFDNFTTFRVSCALSVQHKLAPPCTHRLNDPFRRAPLLISTAMDGFNGAVFSVRHRGLLPLCYMVGSG